MTVSSPSTVFDIIFSLNYLTQSYYWNYFSFPNPLLLIAHSYQYPEIQPVTVKKLKQNPFPHKIIPEQSQIESHKMNSVIHIYMILCKIKQFVKNKTLLHFICKSNSHKLLLHFTITNFCYILIITNFCYILSSQTFVTFYHHKLLLHFIQNVIISYFVTF